MRLTLDPDALPTGSTRHRCGAVIALSLASSYAAPMGRIIAPLTITNALDPSKSMRFSALVDTGAAELVLPAAWRDRLGPMVTRRRVDVQTADQRVMSAEVCGPVIIHIDGFDVVSGEVMFLEMESDGDSYEPLLGYIVLEQSRAAVDLERHRLVPVRALDLKMVAA